MTRYRGDNIPTVSDYSHWNEDAQSMWYAENKYDMNHAYEVMDDDDDYRYEDDVIDDDWDYDNDIPLTDEESKALDRINPWD